MTTIRNSGIYKRIFCNVFRALQLSGLYVLYYDLDWTESEIKEFGANLIEINRLNISGEIKLSEMRETICTITGVDCVEENDKFPYRTKIKMCDLSIRPKFSHILGISADDATEAYLELAFYTLVDKYEFDGDQLRDWVSHLKDFCKLYTQGMTDKHVLEYFEKEVGMTITE